MFLTTYWPFKKIKKFFHGCKETSDSLTSHAGNSAFTHQVRPVIKAEIHSGWSWDCFFFRSQRSNTSKGRPNDTLPCQATTFLPQGQTLGGEESRDYSPAVITGEIENSFSWSLHNRAFFDNSKKNQGQKISSLKKNSSKLFKNSIICKLKTYFLLKKSWSWYILHKSLPKLKF